MNEQITLLDGTSWYKDDIISRMYDDKFYYGYLGENALSSSSAKKLLVSPKQYESSLHENNNNVPALREGRLFHMMALEEHKIDDNYLFIDSSTRTTNKYKDFVAENPHKEVMLTKEYNVLSDLLKHLHRNLEASELLRGGQPEIPMIGNIFGYPFRGKADYLKDNHVIDLKTTSKLEGWVWAAKNTWHYDMQCYIYKHLYNVQKFTFLVIEKGTGEIGIYDVSEESMQKAGHKLKKVCKIYEEYFIRKTKDPNEFVRRGTI
tara:strand:+ start:448 stop:1233 length:786 start_codon:yes stop_codon:yes gene_type:complete